MIALMLSRVSPFTNGELLMTRDTVFFDTLARRAMSLMVGLRPRGTGNGTRVSSAPTGPEGFAALFVATPAALRLWLNPGRTLREPGPPCQRCP